MFNCCDGSITSYRLRRQDYRDNGSSREQDRDKQQVRLRQKRKMRQLGLLR